MADTISSERRSENMRKIRSKDMKPEMVVRKLVHSLGYRYRLHRKDLPGKPDLVFGPKKKVIFVNGCFWHSHDDPSCPIARIPKSNQDFWIPKLQRTKERDKEHLKKLQEKEWYTLTVWECQIQNQDNLKKLITRFLR